MRLMLSLGLLYNQKRHSNIVIRVSQECQKSVTRASQERHMRVARAHQIKILLSTTYQVDKLG